MYAISDRFLAGLTAGYRIATRVEVLGTSGAAIATLAPHAGKVTVDSSQAIRRQGRIELTDPTGTLTPRTAQDLLAPYSNEIRLSRGMTFSDGTTELVVIATLGFDTVEINEQGGQVVISLSGFDRAQRIINAGYEVPYSLTAGNNVGTAIQGILNLRAPGLTYSFAPTTALTPAVVFGDSTSSDPWRDCQQLATDIGMELFFDPMGVCVMRPVPNPDGDAVFSISEGSNLLSASRTMSTAKSYNVVVATGEGGYAGTGGSASNVAQPVRGTAEDTNPMSPTYAGSGRRKVKFYSSPLITTSSQATDAARGILRRSLGSTETVSGTLAPNPALEASDVIYVRRTKLGVDARYNIDSFDIPLAATEAMPFVGRERSVA